MERNKELSFEMKDRELKFFLIETEYQAEIALAALDELERYTIEFYKYKEESKKLREEKKAIWGIKEPQKRRKEQKKVNAKIDACKIRIWLLIQSFLTATANVSKIFWPPDKNKNPSKAERRRKRGLKLKEELGISSDSLKKRTIRNHFIHFDERIDKWAKKEGNLFYRIIGSLEAIKMGNIEPKEFFHHYDPMTKVITFYRNPYHLEDIKKEIQDIQQKVKQHHLLSLNKRNPKHR